MNHVFNILIFFILLPFSTSEKNCRFEDNDHDVGVVLPLEKCCGPHKQAQELCNNSSHVCCATVMKLTNAVFHASKRENIESNLTYIKFKNLSLPLEDLKPIQNFKFNLSFEPQRICQYRVDFFHSSIQTNINYTFVPECSLAKPYDINAKTWTYFIVTSSFDGIHIYVDATDRPITFGCVFDQGTSATLDVRFIQIPCVTGDVVPAECHQYYRGLQGTVKGLTFDKFFEYVICVEAMPGFGNITWTSDSLFSFGERSERNDTRCRHQQLIIPGAKNPVCGQAFTDEEDERQNKPIRSILEEGKNYFTVQVLLNSIDGWPKTNGHFVLHFQQNKN